MRNVLVISDNAFLVDCIKSRAQSLPSDQVNISFRYSSTNKQPEQLENRGLEPINLKSRETIDSLISNYQLIISAHCKQIFPSALVAQTRCINIHPGLNPYNRGWYPQVFSIINKKPIGCTIHLMDEEIDHGPNIYQKSTTIDDTDTSLDVYERVLNLEKQLIEDHLEDLINETYSLQPATSNGNYNGISDFNNLCQLNLDNQSTLKEHIDLLRALTHGHHQNAYFVGEKGRRIYVKITLTEEAC